MQTIINLIAAGIGVSLVPASLINLQRRGVVYRPLQEQTPAIELALAWRPAESSPVLPQFLEVIRGIAKNA